MSIQQFPIFSCIPLIIHQLTKTSPQDGHQNGRAMCNRMYVLQQKKLPMWQNCKSLRDTMQWQLMLRDIGVRMKTKRGW